MRSGVRLLFYPAEAQNTTSAGAVLASSSTQPVQLCRITQYADPHQGYHWFFYGAEIPADECPGRSKQ